MAKVLYPITACLKKSNSQEEAGKNTEIKDDDQKALLSPVEVQPGLIRKMSSRLYNLGSGAVGLGVGSVKWAANTTYNVGTGVFSVTQNVASKVGVVSKPKSKKE